MPLRAIVAGLCRSLGLAAWGLALTRFRRAGLVWEPP